jgi:hypothetical protein
MRLLSTRLGLALSLLVGVVPLGCSTATSAASVNPGSYAPGSTSLVFDDDGPLTLAPGAVQPLYVTATPPAEYGVRFKLVGPAGDASLSDSVVMTGENGLGRVTLTAPTEAATFAVHATLLDASGAPTMTTAERFVAVSEQGFGSVVVVPSYTGKRTVTSWTASVTTSADCKTLDLEPPGDPPGAITATALSGSNPVIDGAPAGTALAVTLRAGHFLWGCADVGGLVAGSTLDVPVTVTDVPLDFMGATVAVTLGFTPDPSTYQSLLGDTVSTLVDAFMPSDADEGPIVLNAMAAGITSPGDLTAFTTDRATLDWDDLASAHFANLSKGLRETCSTWATAGTAAQPTTFLATLTGGSLPGEVSVAVTQFGALDPAAVGLTTDPDAPYSWLAGDTVQVNAAVTWDPTAFAGAASLLPARQAQPAATTVADALTLVADCQGLATAMGAFGQCDVACVEGLCDQAIASRWTAALGISQSTSTLGHLQIQASTTATVGDMAQPEALQGQWQGTLDDGVVTVPVVDGTVQPAPGSG